MQTTLIVWIVVELSLGRTLDDNLFFWNRLKDLLNFIFPNGDKDGIGEMEEEFVENLGKHHIGR